MCIIINMYDNRYVTNIYIQNKSDCLIQREITNKKYNKSVNIKYNIYVNNTYVQNVCKCQK